MENCHLYLPAPQLYPLNFKIKHGLYGSGNHSSSNLLSNLNIDRSHFIIFMVSPLKVSDRFGNVLWENRHPNSPFSNQPVALICQKENIDSVTELCNLINPKLVHFTTMGLFYTNGQINMSIIASMFDGKALSVMTGKGGAPCIACKSDRSDINNLLKVVCGFP